MNYSGLIKYDTGNSHGLSVTLFVSGCQHCGDAYDNSGHCVGCHNPHTWNFDAGKPFTEETFNEIVEQLKYPYIKNFVITGGEPLHPKNVDKVFDILFELMAMGLLQNKKVIVYTGYSVDVLTEEIQQDLTEENISKIQSLLILCDYLITEPYIPALPTKGIELRGSTNQKCFRVRGFAESKTILEDITDKYFTDDYEEEDE